MHRLSPEERLVLLLSRPEPSREAIETAGYLIAGCAPDYDRLLSLARTNGVSSLLYHNLKSLEAVPEDVISRLRSGYLWTIGENLRRGAELVHVITLLKKNGIEAVPLKGPVASDLIFGDPGLYPSGDLDILVRPADLERTKKLLLGFGYKESGMAEADMLEGSYHIIFEKGRHSLEVHWNLTFRYFNVPPGFWWEDARAARYQGEEVLTLSPERYLLYAIFRLYSHAFRPLRFLVLVTEIIRKCGEETGQQMLLDLSKTCRMERLVRFTLKLSHDLLGCPVPEEVLRSGLRGYHFLRRLVLSGLFHDVKKIHTRMFFFTALQQTPLDTLKVLLKRVFPSLSEVRLRYRLPLESRMVWLYYLANPLLLFFRKR